jgi:hypothetical protein
VPPPTSLQPTQGTKPGGISSTGADTLRLQASEPSWMEVRDANGKTFGYAIGVDVMKLAW